MHMSNLVGKTLKKYDNQFDLKSHELLFRTGMFREIDQGSFAALPLGVEVINNVVGFLTKRLKEFGFQRIHISTNGDFEKNVSLAVRNDIKSYKELPAFLYDIQTLVRDFIKVREGLVSGREYKTLRGCSFHTNDSNIGDIYNETRKFYEDLFRELGVEVLSLLDYYPSATQKDGHRFVAKTNKGNRSIYTCDECHKSFLEETSNFYIDESSGNAQDEIEEIHTPNIKTINELIEFLDLKANELAKTLLIKVKDEIVAVVLRGDRELNKYKLSKVLGVSIEDIEMAEEDDMENINTVTGFVGPVGLEGIKIIVDKEVDKQGPFITGANKRDYHYKNVWIARDIHEHIIADISYIQYGDKCSECGGNLNKEWGIDIGGMFNFGETTNIGNFNYKDKEGKTNAILGLCYNVDIYRLLSVIVENHYDEGGIVWPMKIAPYHVIVSILNTKFEEKVELGKKIYKELMDANIKAILDERNTGAGAKFKDADLLGIPIRITIGKKADEKIVEFKLRSSEEKEELKVHEALGKTMKILRREDII